jgi:cytosine/adenosine deaminase-related metal-dependent hydrolase
LLSRGVRVGLGADGAACDNTIDQRFELRLAALLPRLSGGPTVMSAQTAFDLATIGGARALGAERDIGSIEVGKRADLVCLRPRMAPIVDPVSALVFGATATTIESVMVDGVMRVSEGTLAEGSFEATLDRAQAAQNSIRKRAGV